MTAAEAKKKALWNSIPASIRTDIQNAVRCGIFYTYLYKSSIPEAFNHINTTIEKLQLLGYKAEYDTVDAVDLQSDPCTITSDTKLTITW